MTKAFVNCFVHPQYFPWYTQTLVLMLAEHDFIIYITTQGHDAVSLSAFGGDSHSNAFVTILWSYCEFMICLAFIVDNVHANISLPLCWLSLYVSLLPKEVWLNTWRGGGAIVLYVFHGEICGCTHTHIHTSVPPSHFRREKLYLHLHKNNWHFKLALQ